MMTKAEYEEQKQELETRHRISIQFLQKGYEAQLRALKSEWIQAAEAPPPPEWDAPRREETSAPAAETALVEYPPWAYLPGGLLESVRQAVERLPAEFKKEDIVRLLGFKPERSSLHRAMDTLMNEQKIRIHIRGFGRAPNIYRKLAGDAPESP
jgi:hypothetical protein